MRRLQGRSINYCCALSRAAVINRPPLQHAHLQMQITQPVTMLTDYALGAVTFYFAFVLARTMGPHNRVSGWLWSAAFGFSAVGALVGGSFHAFALELAESTLHTLWT